MLNNDISICALHIITKAFYYYYLLTAYVVTTVETIGDVTATHEVSELSTDGKEYTVRLALFFLHSPSAL
jgi:xanthine/uracil permease